MCGRYSSSSSTKDLAKIFDVDEARLPKTYPPSATSPPACPLTPSPSPAATGDSGRKKAAHRVLGTFQWGLVPSWAKDRKSATA